MSIKVTTRNLFDWENIKYSQNNAYLTRNGEIIPTESWGITDFYRVSSGEIVLSGITGSAPSICGYDENYNFVAGKHYESKNIARLSDDRICFVRFTVLQDSQKWLKRIQLEEGTEATPYIPHFLEVNRIVQTTRNLFDKDRALLEYEISNESINANPGWFVTDYISVDVNKSYVKNNVGRAVLEYDADKNYIGRIDVENIVSGFNPNTKFIRLNSLMSSLDIFQLEIGTEATPYVPHLLEIKSVKQSAENSMKTLFEKEIDND